MIAVPEPFAAMFEARSGEAGRTWIASLPATVVQMCERWDLVVDGAPMHGELSLVIPVSREGDRLVLKVAWLDETTAHEALALAVWDGRGAVKLLASDPELGALLLERVESHRSLRDVPLEEAVIVAGQLLRRLAVPAPVGPPTLAAMAGEMRESLPERWYRLGHPMPRRTLDAARELAQQLSQRQTNLLVDYDLHYDNVLAVDPKVVVGDPEYEIAQLLWWRFDEIEEGRLLRYLDALVDAARCDAEISRAWTVVRSVDYWLWGLANGLTEDPVRCAAIVEAL